MLQPNTMVFSDVSLYKYSDLRWAGSEDGRVPYENWNVIDRAGYLRWRPVEADTPLRKLHWFWHPNDEASLKSVDELVKDYDESVGHGAQLMLGIAPDRNGRVPDSDVARLKEFGAAIRARYGRSLLDDNEWSGEFGYARPNENPDATWTSPDAHSGVMGVKFSKPVTLDSAMTMEWLTDGQHVQRYAIEVEHGGRWERVAGGEAIGHKKIDHFAPVTAQEVRLHVLASTSAAHIREFQLYSTGTVQ
jgi:alpha-L-fucosidase